MFNAHLSNAESETIQTETMFLKNFKHPYIVDYSDFFNEKDLFCYVKTDLRLTSTTFSGTQHWQTKPVLTAMLEPELSHF